MKRKQSYFQDITELSDVQTRIDASRLSAKVVGAMTQVQPLFEIADRGRFKEALSLLYFALSHDYFRMVNRYKQKDVRSKELILFSLVPPIDVKITKTRNFYDLFTSFEPDCEYQFLVEDNLHLCGRDLILFTYESYLRNLCEDITKNKFLTVEARVENTKSTYYALFQQIKRTYSRLLGVSKINHLPIQGRIFALEYEVPVEDCFRHTVSNVESDCLYLPFGHSQVHSICFNLGNSCYTIDSVSKGCEVIISKPKVDLELIKDQFTFIHFRGVTVIFAKGKYFNTNTTVKGECYVLRFEQALFSFLKDSSFSYSLSSPVEFSYTRLPNQKFDVPEGKTLEDLPSSVLFTPNLDTADSSAYMSSVYTLCKHILSNRVDGVEKGGCDA